MVQLKHDKKFAKTQWKVLKYDVKYQNTKKNATSI